MPAFQFYDLAPGASSDTHTLKWQHPSDLVLLVRSRVWAEPTPKDRKNPEARRAEGDSKAAGYAYNTFSVLLDGVPVPAKFCRTRPRVRKILAKGGSRAEPHREVALWGLTGGDVARFTAPWSTDFRATVISDDYMFQDMPDERVFRRCPCDRDRAVKPECDCRYVHAPLDDPYLLEFVVPYGVLEEGAGVDRPVTLQFKVRLRPPYCCAHACSGLVYAPWFDSSRSRCHGHAGWVPYLSAPVMATCCRM